MPIAKMTLGERINAHASFTKRFESSTLGPHQFMGATLQALSKELRLRGTQMFDPGLQDRLGYHRVISRG